MTAPSALVDESAALVTTPSIPAEESVAFVTTPTVLVHEPADSTALLETTSDTGKAEDPEYPKWIKVHSSHPTPSMGSVPPTLGHFRQHCCNCSSSWRRAQHHRAEEQQALKGDSSSSSPQSSLRPACHEEEDPGGQLTVPPLGFKKDC